MIKTYRCPQCGEAKEVWRQLTTNLPRSLPCGCGGEKLPQTELASIIHFKGAGWTVKGTTDVKDLKDVKGLPSYIGNMLD